MKLAALRLTPNRNLIDIVTTTLAVLLTLLSLTTFSSTASAEDSEVNVPDGWTFQATAKSDPIQRPHQIGNLNETSKTPLFTTAPVLLIPIPGLAQRSQTAQLARLAKEVVALVNPRSAQYDHTSKKIANGQPRVEAQYGKPGKGLTWAYASIEGDHILVMMTQSRELKPPSLARDDFFKMARAFKPAAFARETPATTSPAVSASPSR